MKNQISFKSVKLNESFLHVHIFPCLKCNNELLYSFVLIDQFMSTSKQLVDILMKLTPRNLQAKHARYQVEKCNNCPN